ncbi:MAG: prolipoprotein diacylglyceryl transferase [Proteobacteria bacterium]|nr:prolipoprotein diacylglyceryl transferase [Pseudomonadota bacterium]
MSAVAVVAFVILAFGTKLLTGNETHVYYRFQNVILVLCAIFLWLSGEPVLCYLDIAILGLGAFLACGRIGCLALGCCHGRPCRFGLHYRKEHADESFSRCLVGVKLFPIQAVEALFVTAIVFVGFISLVGGAPGEVLSLFIITYGAGRFFIELARGDAARAFFYGFSEAQWTSLLLMAFVVLGEFIGLLIFNCLHIVLASVILISTALIALSRKLDPSKCFELLRPRHVEELAEIIFQNKKEPQQKIRPRQTSMGIRISFSEIDNLPERFHLYSISHKDGILSDRALKTIAKLVSRISNRRCKARIVSGCKRVHHLLFDE